jgi:hypothetical protein
LHQDGTWSCDSSIILGIVDEDGKLGAMLSSSPFGPRVAAAAR